MENTTFATRYALNLLTSKTVIAGAIRHGLTAGGGGLAVSGGDVELLAGGISVAVGLIWSAVKNRK